MNIRAVIFDFGKVLCFGPQEADWREAAAFCGADRSAFEDAFWQYRDAYDAGEDPRIYWSRVSARLGKAFDLATVDGLIQREIAFWSRFDDRMLRWSGELRAAGLRTGILSNLPRPLGETLKTLAGFIEQFDQATFSYEIGVIKPAAGIYRSSMEGLGIAPSEGLFLDDRADNVEGGRAIGLHGEIFTTWEEFLATGPARYGLPAPRV